ncbi:hypothetical protein [Ottowia thiooxydans]
MPDFDTGIRAMPFSRNRMYSRSAEIAAAFPEIQVRIAVGEAGGNRDSLLNESSDSRDALAQKIAAFQWVESYESKDEKFMAIQKGFEVMRKWKTVLFFQALQQIFSQNENDFLTSMWCTALRLQEVEEIRALFLLAEGRYLERFSGFIENAQDIKGLIFTWDELKVMEEARDSLLGKELLWEMVLDIYEDAKSREEQWYEPWDYFQGMKGLKIQDDLPDRKGQAWTNMFFNHVQGTSTVSQSGLLFWGEFLSTSQRPVSVTIVDSLPEPINPVVDRNPGLKGSLTQLRQAADARWAAPSHALNQRPVAASPTETDVSASAEPEWDELEEFIPPWRWF